MSNAFQSITSGDVTANTSSARTLLGDGSSLLLTNLGSVVVRIKLGDSTVVAVAADTALLPNSAQSFRRPLRDSHIAYITASGTATLNISIGEGL